MKLATLLNNHDAKNELYEFSKNLTLQEFYETCPRGDWMLQILTLTHPTKKNELRLAAAHCANTVRHLMADKRSTDVIDYIINNNGEKPPLKLIKNAAYAAYAANGYYAAATDAAYADSAAAYDAAAYAADAADAASASAAAAADAAAASAASAATRADAIYHEFNKQMIEIIESIIR